MSLSVTLYAIASSFRFFTEFQSEVMFAPDAIATDWTRKKVKGELKRDLFSSETRQFLRTKYESLRVYIKKGKKSHLKIIILRLSWS